MSNILLLLVLSNDTEQFPAVCTSNADVVWLSSSPGTVLTVQAMSEDDHKFWMQAMDGKEAVSQPPAPCCVFVLLTLESCSSTVCCLTAIFLRKSFFLCCAATYLHFTVHHDVQVYFVKP